MGTSGKSRTHPEVVFFFFFFFFSLVEITLFSFISLVKISLLKYAYYLINIFLYFTNL